MLLLRLRFMPDFLAFIDLRLLLAMFFSLETIDYDRIQYIEYKEYDKKIYILYLNNIEYIEYI
jgi:hypothetical protein